MQDILKRYGKSANIGNDGIPFEQDTLYTGFCKDKTCPNVLQKLQCNNEMGYCIISGQTKVTLNDFTELRILF